METQLPTPRYNMGEVTFGNAVYLFGGYDGTYLTDILKFNPATSQISTVGHMAYPREAPTVFSNGTGVFILGGDGPVNQPNSAVEFFNPSTRTDTVLSITTPTPLSAEGLAQIGGYVYLLGGKTGTAFSTETNQILRFDPSTLTFTVLTATLPAPLEAWWGTTVSDGKAVILGGIFADDTMSNQVVEFNPTDGSVSVAATLPFSLYVSVAPRADKVFAFGGSVADIAPSLRSILRFNSASNQVSKLSCRLPYPVASEAIATVPGGYFLFGGLDKVGSGRFPAETYSSIVFVSQSSL
ncbi:MAG: Kelch repeat-containing protein [Nitrososphaerales archaeon]